MQDERGARQGGGEVDYAGQTYYFCSDACHKAFITDPQKYAGGAPQGGHGGSHWHGHE